MTGYGSGADVEPVVLKASLVRLCCSGSSNGKDSRQPKDPYQSMFWGGSSFPLEVLTVSTHAV